MTEKRQTSQGYIIRILQHFAMKLRNITNFVMLFQAVMKLLLAQAYLDQNFTHKGKGLLNKCTCHRKNCQSTNFVRLYGSTKKTCQSNLRI